MMINLKRLRETGLDYRLLECGSSQAFPYLDQDLINFTCPEEIGLLPKEYNVFPDDTEKEWASWPFPGNRTLAGALLDPAIFHYIGPDKPWVKPVPGDAYWLEAEAGFLRWRDSR
jgi:lipopolysaccharide biosynthesis glycosyltransferase